MTIYNISMNPKSFEGNEVAFMNKVASFLSFYEYQFYIFILLPMYLVFISTNNKPFIQRIIRSRSRKLIALESIKNTMISSAIYTTTIFLVGIIYPYIYNVISLNFVIVYALQCLLMGLLFSVVGNFVLILETFTNNISFKIGIPMMVIMLYHLLQGKIYNIFIEINFAIINYAYKVSLRLEDLIIIIGVVILLLLGSMFIKLYICSEEEYK